jgi:hypothetical protein
MAGCDVEASSRQEIAPLALVENSVPGVDIDLTIFSASESPIKETDTDSGPFVTEYEAPLAERPTL